MPPPPLKKPSEFKLLGKPQPRLDIPAKVAGTATFGIDVRLPGLLYAAIRQAPTFGGQASSFKVKGSLPKGVETVLIVPGGSPPSARAGGAPTSSSRKASTFSGRQALSPSSTVPPCGSVTRS